MKTPTSPTTTNNPHNTPRRTHETIGTLSKNMQLRGRHGLFEHYSAFIDNPPLPPDWPEKSHGAQNTGNQIESTKHYPAHAIHSTVQAVSEITNNTRRLPHTTKFF